MGAGPGKGEGSKTCEGSDDKYLKTHWLFSLPFLSYVNMSPILRRLYLFYRGTSLTRKRRPPRTTIKP